uniref:MFS transporter n=1 Tax=Cyberlindnera americana TaxID=36016 RepID=A0A5P8N9E8_9ASCO|nr:MFS transporter [Cyberlindnera americana]
MDDLLRTVLTHKSSRATLLSKRSSIFALNEDYLRFGTPPQTPLIPYHTNTDTVTVEAKDSTEPYTVEHDGHLIHIYPKDWRHSALLRSQICVCFFLFSLTGLADQTIGTLMPTLVEHFHSTQTDVTVIFMTSFIGYTLAAFVNEIVHSKCGRRGVLIIGCLGPMITFAVNSFHDSLPLFVGIYVIMGLGTGLMGSAINVYLSSLVDRNELMGLLHGFYGVGSIISPPLVSWISSKMGYKYFYFILSLLYFIGLLCVVMTFKHETKWKYSYMILPTECDYDFIEAPEPTGPLEMLKKKLILAFCMFLFFYVGSETSIGSWLLTYLKEVKGVDQFDAAIIVSWFWSGLTFGRMALGFLTKTFSTEYIAAKLYGWLSWVSYTAFVLYSLSYDGEHFVLFCKPFVFIAGTFIGPIYPTVSVVLLKLLPIHQQVSGVGIASSIGGSGSAIVPFIVGSISRSIGFNWLLVVIDIVLLAYCFVWEGVPKFSGSLAHW